ncbi:MAG TPA: manganese-binding transcriptional regulator MntR [Vicinamibacterales bacterium]|nr:manganese-binding transcriptional regulator MntR [Vicinamibacterales bacterium]
MNRTPAGARRPRPLSRNPRRTREEHSEETAQDYVEMIAELIDTTGEARVIDLARRLGVTHVTVSRTLQRLRREGLVTSLPYRSIFLTPAGTRLSEESRHRHEVVVEFLQSLGVPATVAHSDAEGIEHHVSRETLHAFVKHLQAGPWRRARRKRARSR